MSVAPQIRPLDVVLAPLRWLEQARGWRRRLLILTYLIVGTIIGLLTWRATSLRNLPDIGDPFDVQAFRNSAKVPEADDALVLYRRAAEQYVPSVVTQDPNGLNTAIGLGWALCRPEPRAWVETNRPALTTWLAATDKPRTSPISPTEMTRVMSLLATIQSLGQAASLEASRHQELGDAKTAWIWHRGVLRACHHLRMNNSMTGRSAANMLQEQAQSSLRWWIASAETDAALLRAAIDEITRLDSQVPLNSDTFKADYLQLLSKLDDPATLGPQIDSNYETTKPYLQGILFMKREPERSRRVARLMYANWLAFCDRPKALLPPVVSDPKFPGVWYLFQTDARTPASARRMEPQAILDAFKTTWFLLPTLTPMSYFFPSAEQEHRVYADLMVFAAERLYLLENGKKAPGIEALVPRYLKTIPDSYAPAPISPN